MLFATAFVFAACGGEAENQEGKDGKEYTSAYICPMHCEGSGSSDAGKCPVCGMNYVANPDHTTDVQDNHNHNHDHDHDHDH